MAISSAGVGTGIDAESIIAKLVAIERQPITQIDTRKKGVNEQISAYGRILSAVESLRTAAGKIDSSYDFQSYAATVADTEYASATASSLASAGSFSLYVQQLAQAHKLKSVAAPDVSAGGTLDITIGGAPTPVTITIAPGATLADLRSAINAADAGVTATIVNGSGGEQLVLTSAETGLANAITLGGSLTAALSFSNVTTAQDAIAKIDGISVTGSSNTLEDAVTGVSITLKKAHALPTDTTTVTVAADTETMTSQIESFVKAWNDLNGLFKSLTKYDAANKKASTLTGDQTIRGIENQLRNTLFSSPGGVGSAFPQLSSLGITLSSDGALALDKEKLGNSLTTNFADAVSTVTAFGGSFKTLTDSFVAASGSLTTRTTSLNATLALLEDRKEALEVRVSAIEKRYRAQFTALDALVGNLQTQSSYLSQQIARLA